MERKIKQTGKRRYPETLYLSPSEESKDKRDRMNEGNFARVRSGVN